MESIMSILSPLALLWESTQKFHDRFRGQKPSEPILSAGQPMQTAIWVFDEEVREFLDAAYEDDAEAVAEEAADVLVTMIGILMVWGLPFSDFGDAIRKVAAKNDAKQYDTHFVDPFTGKIRRRQNENDSKDEPYLGRRIEPPEMRD